MMMCVGGGKELEKLTSYAVEKLPNKLNDFSRETTFKAAATAPKKKTKDKKK